MNNTASWQQVGCELGTGELQTKGLCERTRGERLAQARKIFDQDMPAGEHPAQHQTKCVALADDGRVDLVEHLVGQSRSVRWGDDYRRSDLVHNASMSVMV